MGRERTLRVFLADDHPLMRVGLRLSLGQLAGIEIVGEASDGFSAVERIRATLPDVALIDVDMPGLSGIGAIRILRKALPDMIAIVLSTYNDDDYIRQSLNAGAHGYVLKAVSSDELVNIIKDFAAGVTPVSPYLVSLGMMNGVSEKRSEQTEASALTEREAEVLRLLAAGRRTKEIAIGLNVGTETVKTHLKSIYRKLGVKSRAEAVVAAAGRMQSR